MAKIIRFRTADGDLRYQINENACLTTIGMLVCTAIGHLIEGEQDNALESLVEAHNEIYPNYHNEKLQ